VGNAAFCQRFDEVLGTRSVRYVNDRDIVTRVLPPLLGGTNGGFAHVNHVRRIDPNGEMDTTMPSAALHALDLVKAFALLRSPALPENLADHTALYYALHCWNDFGQHFAEKN
jgi:hypothetical protein